MPEGSQQLRDLAEEDEATQEGRGGAVEQPAVAAPKVPTLVTRALRSPHLYPALLLILLAVPVLFSVHGSSIGQQVIRYYGADYEDPDLLFGEPRPIRSDEWLVTTPATLAQVRNNLNEINPNIADGQQMSIVIDVPNRNLAGIFEPQNAGFFVFGFARGLAFKWWFLAYALLVSAYYFALPLVGRRAAVLISFVGFLAPFVHWWYQTITILPMAYGLGILTLIRSQYGVRHSKWRESATLVALAYLIVAFALVQYPPFQIPVALVGAAWFVGYMLDFDSAEQRHARGMGTRIRGFVADNRVLLVALAVAGAILGVVLLQLSEEIAAVANSAHPGDRSFASGGGDLRMLVHALSGHLQLFIQGIGGTFTYFTNESEASSFLFVLPFLAALFVIDQLRRASRSRDVMFQGVAVLTITSLFFVWLAVPGLDLVFKPLLLENVPYRRLLMGFGFAQLVFLPIFVGAVRTHHRPKLDRSVPYVLVALTAGVVLLATNTSRLTFPGYVLDIRLALIASALMVGCVAFLMLGRVQAGLLILIALGGWSVYQINPLYQGADILTSSPIDLAIRRIASEDPGARWAAANDIQNENLPAQNGVPTLSGNYFYPKLDFWEPLDPTGEFEVLYNRYLHSFIRMVNLDDPEAPPRLELQGNTVLAIGIDPCRMEGLESLELTYLIFNNEQPNPCLTLVETVPFPRLTFYIYRIDG